MCFALVLTSNRKILKCKELILIKLYDMFRKLCYYNQLQKVSQNSKNFQKFFMIHVFRGVLVKNEVLERIYIIIKNVYCKLCALGTV